MSEPDPIVFEFLHFLKAGKHVISSDLTANLKRSNHWCPFTHGKDKETELNCYLLDGGIRHIVNILNKYYICFEYLEINPYELPSLRKQINTLEDPRLNLTHTTFKENLKQIIDFIKTYERDVYTANQKLTCDESIRLDEALRCLDSHCYLASVTMAVSSVESRLHHLLLKKDRKLYKKYFESSTLGGIIKIFDQGAYKDPIFAPLKSILPEKHKPLMDLLNKYRVFSAHPKSEHIDYNIAHAILQLSFVFLLDDELKVNLKLRKHRSSKA